jgi:hypothetical protein
MQRHSANVCRHRAAVPRAPWIGITVAAIVALGACQASGTPPSAQASLIATEAPVTSVAPATATPTGTAMPVATTTVVDGEWEVTTTRADILNAGLIDNEEDNPGNWGHITMSLHAGAYTITQLDNDHQHDAGTYVIRGTTIVLDTMGHDLFAYPFTVSPTTLTLLPVLDSSGAIDFQRTGPVGLRAKPWTRTGP